MLFVVARIIASSLEKADPRKQEYSPTSNEEDEEDFVAQTSSATHSRNTECRSHFIESQPASQQQQQVTPSTGGKVTCNNKYKFTCNTTSCKMQNHKLARNAKYLLPYLILVTYWHRTLHASGVFEFELQDIQRLNKSPIVTAAGMRLLMCLKEAFAQADGPCVFGNASLKIPAADEAATSGESRQIRIPFSFRWTKSFTMILTAQEINGGGGQETHARDLTQQQQQQISGAQANATTQAADGAPQHHKSALAGLSAAGSQAATGSSSSSSSALATTADEHVLTECEALPNLAANPVQHWTSRATRTERTLLVFRFRILCAANYYGDGCATFCRPRDDHFGHYNCSATGQRLCLEGWTGQECNRARCAAGCNQQHGFCDKPHTCSCRPGWTGARCDECLTYPGCQQGYCLGPWQCVCRNNWGGVLCDQDLNFCGSHEPCQNNATCQNVAPDRYKCNCAPNFTGVNCEVRLEDLRLDLASSMTQLSAGCALNPCLNGGTCFGFEAQPAGSRNDSTQLLVAEQQQVAAVSGNSQQQQQQQQIYRCQCPPGWTGDYCQWSEAGVGPPPVVLEPPPVSSNATSGPLASNSTAGLAVVISTAELTATVASYETSTPQDAVESLHQVLAHHQQASHVEMRHLISGVVIASAVGVFAAALLLAWCCLLAIEKGRFHFIQMNVIRHTTTTDAEEEHSSTGGSGVVGFSSRLRRVHEKIRDSLRRGSGASASKRACIKPETKLSIENVLAAPKWPPPSYEESSSSSSSSNLNRKLQASSLHRFQAAASHLDHLDQLAAIEEKFTSRERQRAATLASHTRSTPTTASAPTTSGLVRRGALEQEMALKQQQQQTMKSEQNTKGGVYGVQSPGEPLVTRAQMNCPKHGHLYRSSQQSQSQAAATTIAIEYQSRASGSHQQQIYQRNHQHYHHHHHQHQPGTNISHSSDNYTPTT